ncbi:hypothetical protein BX265_8139 [Streptomyces sp. TLI_235]|nr:hypothetical protein [Streptomyces sp. TLI_235]PBC67530.1 hypothetical protein BX265_8139 [Streptomyces sp. TLI_235]
MSAITSMDLTGFTPREDETGVWTDERGVVLSVHYFPVVPDLAAPLAEGERLRRELARFTARAGAGLIEASVGELAGMPALRQLVKVRRPVGHGQVFVGSWTVPRQSCSVVLKVQAAEGPVSGMREAVVVDRVGPDAYVRPHPYDPELAGPMPWHVADLPEWDAHFPGHPLTLVRETLARVAAGVVLDERFRALPPFGGPVADADAGPAAEPTAVPPRRRWWQRGR